MHLFYLQNAALITEELNSIRSHLMHFWCKNNDAKQKLSALFQLDPAPADWRAWRMARMRSYKAIPLYYEAFNIATLMPTIYPGFRRISARCVASNAIYMLVSLDLHRY